MSEEINTNLILPQWAREIWYDREEKIKHLESLLAEAGEALDKYGRCFGECQNNRPMGMITGCTCGFLPMLAKIRKVEVTP